MHYDYQLKLFLGGEDKNNENTIKMVITLLLKEF